MSAPHSVPLKRRVKKRLPRLRRPPVHSYIRSQRVVESDIFICSYLTYLVLHFGIERRSHYLRACGRLVSDFAGQRMKVRCAQKGVGDWDLDKCCWERRGIQCSFLGVGIVPFGRHGRHGFELLTSVVKAIWGSLKWMRVILRSFTASMRVWKDSIELRERLSSKGSEFAFR